jgi:hypothetical protein
LTGHFCPVWIGSNLGLEIQNIDVGLSLAPSSDRQKVVGLKRFEVAADVPLVDPKVFGEALLTGEAVVFLPRVAQDHRERHLVAGAEFLRIEEKIGDLGEA